MREKEHQREATLERMMNMYADLLVGLCVGLLGDADMAQDAVQETFLKAWRALPSFRGRDQASEKAWLCRIAVNQCRSMRRSKWFRHVNRSLVLEELPQQVENQPEEIGLYRAIFHLSAKYREVIMLRFYEQIPVDQMAGILHITASSVYRRLEAAKKELNQEMERQAKEDE